MTEQWIHELKDQAEEFSQNAVQRDREIESKILKNHFGYRILKSPDRKQGGKLEGTVIFQARGDWRLTRTVLVGTERDAWPEFTRCLGDRLWTMWRMVVGGRTGWFLTITTRWVGHIHKEGEYRSRARYDWENKLRLECAEFERAATHLSRNAQCAVG